MTEKDKLRVEILEAMDGDEWPPGIRERFIYLSGYARARGFSLICAVGLHHGRKRLSVLVPNSSNPHLAEMCDDIAEMFHMMARRLRQ